MRLASHASLFALVIIITSALGFFREIIIARTFGASLEMDCFIVAFAIVSFIGAILSPQTMQTMFMPTYQDAMSRTPSSANEIINNIAALLFIVLGIGTIAGYVLAPYIVKALMPGFSDDQIHLTKELMRTMMPLVLIYGIASLGHAVCNSHKQFVLPLSSQTLNNVTLLVLLFLLPIHSVHTLAVYHLAGGLVAGIVLLIAYIRLIPNRRINTKNKTHWEAIAATWPLLILAFIDQAALLLPRSFASLLEHGDITALNYGFRLITLPVAIIAMAIASVLFPIIINHVRDLPGKTSGAIHMGTYMLLFCLCPIGALMAIESMAVVHLFFSSGSFDADAVKATASCLTYYAIGIPGFGYLLFLNRIYCAHRRYWHYVYANLIAFAALIIASYALISPMGHNGIALAFTLYCYLACILLIMGMQRFSPTKLINLFTLLRITASIGIASLTLCLWDAGTLWVLILESALFTVSYALSLWLLRDAELRTILLHLGILKPVAEQS